MLNATSIIIISHEKTLDEVKHLERKSLLAYSGGKVVSSEGIAPRSR